MTDYSQNTFFTAKDSLPADDVDKLILGAEIDPELSEISTAIASKYDSEDIATEAQAIAGTNNTTLMTPLRVSQALGVSGGGGGAGVLPDLIALADPGDDRILFWDESLDTATWLDIGTHLEITAGAVLNVVESGIDHDALTNFVADEHIAHSGVTITAGVGLSGGGTIAATRTLNVDINGLTEELTIDPVADDVMFYDNSASVIRKVPVDALLGDKLGDGSWYRNAVQSITSSVAILVYNAETHDTLERGTFSTSTGVYTAGDEACRILISAQVTIQAQAAGEDAEIGIYKNGTIQSRMLVTNRGKFGASGSTVNITKALSLAANDTVDVRVANDGTKNSGGTLQSDNLSIVELA